MEELQKQIIETWQIHNRVSLYLLDAIPDEALGSRPVAKKQGRTVAQQFAHMHNVRIAWFMQSKKDFVKDLKIIPREKAENKKLLIKSFSESGKKIEEFLNLIFENKFKFTTFKPHPMAFLGYLISHDSHHRGQILLALKQSGYKPGSTVQLGLWEWWKR